MFENGKSYSQLKQTCLELTTLNIKLNPIKDGSKSEGKSAYVLFNDKNTKAELFLPSNNEGFILEKTTEGNWSNNEYKLISWKGYVIQKDGKVIFGGN